MPGGTASRREFIRQGLLAAGAAGLGLAGLQACGPGGSPPPAHPGLGPLLPARDETTGLELLRLPEGFRYRTMGWAGLPMADGYPGPQRCDGMGVVAEDGSRITLVRNHELRGSSGPFGNPETAWDVTGGGTTTLLFDRSSERLLSSHVSLNGTLSNCAGGVTPWGTWLSCEEGVLSPELQHLGIQPRQRFYGLDNARKTHGWVFEVAPGGVTNPRPIKAMGQFYHEAAAVDPATGVVYLTEDLRPAAGLYRFVPNTPGDLQDGGRLQMLRAEGRQALVDDVPLLQRFNVDWVDIEDPTRGNSPGTHDEKGVVSQGLAAGGTAFRTLEGCALREGQLYFTSKEGGAARKGQMFRLNLQNATVEKIYEAGSGERFSGPDNVIFSPRGNFVVCEDRVQGGLAGQFLAGLDSSGELYAFCQVNPRLTGAYAGHDLSATARISEWAGVCFSPDGEWMFANVFKPGFTCAITGPWIEGFV